MKTISRVHSPEERAEMRQFGERLALRSQWRLVAGVTILRTAVTRVLPMAGAAGWWVTLACLVPGLLLYALGCGALKRGRSLHKVVYLLAAVALLVDGTSTLTALVTLFTQGVGTAGTQFTLALVAGGMLLFALNREGLARGIYFLRGLILLLLAAVCIAYVSEAKVDHLFPLLGDGASSIWTAFRAGVGMGWVFLLPLLEMPVKKCSYTEPLPVVLLCAGVLLTLSLRIPHEQLTRCYALGDCLVQTVQLDSLFRLIAICLWMGTLFLSFGSACSMAARYALAPWGRSAAWLPACFVLLLTVTQALPVRELWQFMSMAEPWLLAVLIAGATLTFGRRRQ